MDNENSKFKCNPYNINNKLLTKEDILTIMKSLNIQDLNITNLDLFKITFYLMSIINSCVFGFILL